MAAGTMGAQTILAPLFIGVIRLKPGSDIADYLALRPTGIGTLLRSVVVISTISALSAVLSWSLDIRPAGFSVDAYTTMGSPRIYFSAAIFFAPLIDEIIFRGFVISGFERGYLGQSGAVVVSAALWAVTHLHYDLSGTLWVFILGIVFGFARILSGSIYPAIACHITINGIVNLSVARALWG